MARPTNDHHERSLVARTDAVSTLEGGHPRLPQAGPHWRAACRWLGTANPAVYPHRQQHKGAHPGTSRHLISALQSRVSRGNAGSASARRQRQHHHAKAARFTTGCVFWRRVEGLSVPDLASTPMTASTPISRVRSQSAGWTVRSPFSEKKKKKREMASLVLLCQIRARVDALAKGPLRVQNRPRRQPATIPMMKRNWEQSRSSPVYRLQPRGSQVETTSTWRTRYPAWLGILGPTSAATRGSRHSQ